MRISNLIRNTEITCLVINQERSNFDNEDIEVVSSFEKWIQMCCDTRIKLVIDEDGDYASKSIEVTVIE